MPGKNNHIRQFSEEEIQRYLEGKMSSSEKYAIEKAALEDPFLAEALEGYKNIGTQNLAEELGELRSRLHERSGRDFGLLRKIRTWGSAAAAILILSGSVFTWYWFNTGDRRMAQQTDVGEKIKIVEESTDTTTISREAGNLDTVPTRQKKIETKEMNTAKVPLTKKDTTALSTTPLPAPAVIASGVTDENLDLRKSEITAAASERLPAPVERQAKRAPAGPEKKERALLKEPLAVPAATEGMIKESNSPGAYVIMGKITDELNHPLPFVNIQINGSPYRTYSDARGNFRLVTGDSTLIVNVKSVGYQPRQVDVSTHIPVNTIKLREKVELSPALAISKRSAKDTEPGEKEEISGDEDEAEPVDGWAQYEIYLNNNIRTPELINGNAQGFVDLSFFVDKYGRLSDFHIIHSTCPVCSKEAIRLIKEGPKWKLPQGSSSPSKVVITLQF